MSSDWELLSRIFQYSATHTTDAVFIIGGAETTTVIAQFKQGKWINHSILQRGRVGHGAITIGTETIIVGGKSNEE